MDLTKKIYNTYLHMATIGYYDASQDVAPDKSFTDFVAAVDRSSNVNLLLAMKEDLDKARLGLDNVTTYKRHKVTEAYEYFISKFSIDDYPEIYV